MQIYMSKIIFIYAKECKADIMSICSGLNRDEYRFVRIFCGHEVCVISFIQHIVHIS